MREKIRFGKRYYQNEAGEWIYLADTMREAEYRDKVKEATSTAKDTVLILGIIGLFGYLALFKPEVLEEITSNPVVMAIAWAIGIPCILLLLVIVYAMAKAIVPEMVYAFKRDILGTIDDNNEE